MAVDIIDSFILGTDLPLDSRYVVNSYNDVSMYWYAGMQVFQETDQQLYWYDGSIWIPITDTSISGNFATIEYVDGSLALRDASITELLTPPLSPSGLSLVDYDSYVEVSFNGDINNDWYEIWSSEIDASSNFSMVGKITKDFIDTSIAFADDSFTIKGDLWYKIFAYKYGLSSDPADASIITTGDVSDVTNVSVVPFAHQLFVEWKNPIDPRLSSVQVKIDWNPVASALSEGSAVLAYEGLSENTIIPIANADKDDFYKIYLYAVTKT